MQRPFVICGVHMYLHGQFFCFADANYSKSFNLKKRIPNSEENMAIFKDVHEPIVSRAAWERIQEKRGKARKRKAFRW